MEFESDDALVRAVERGGADASRAIAALFNRHLARVYSLCRRYSTVREDAEEAASETFLRSFRALSQGQFRGEAQYVTWLMRIAGNTCIERLRQPRLPTLSLESLVEESPDRFAAPADARSSDSRILEAVRQLPDDQSLAITLCDLEGYTSREAAEIMRRSPEAMKSLHYRARRALRDIIVAGQQED